MNAETTNPPPANPITEEWLNGLYDATMRESSATDPHALTALTLRKVLGLRQPEVEKSLTKGELALQKGSLEEVEGKLLCQAVALDSVFHSLTQRAYTGSMPLATLTEFLKLGLRAQAQSARTLEIIANIKQGTRVVIAGQLNAATQQIVNNGPPPQPPERIVRSAKKQNSPRARARGAPKQLQSPIPAAHAMDPRSKRTPAPAHSKLVPLA
jgi:hypothetical protein